MAASGGSPARLKVLDKPGLRSTPDRVRETMFNWLGQDLSCWRCVDAFAGTGVLGLEAASRAAVHVLMVEQDAVLVRDLQENATRQATKHGVTTGVPSASSGLAQGAL